MTLFKCILMFAGTYYFTAIVQTVLHRVFGHHDRIRKVYDTHAKGHHGKYPPNQLQTDEWLDSEQHVMWYYALLFVPAAVVVVWTFGLGLFLVHVSGTACAIWWHIYLHKQYHLRGSRWERFEWFQKKRALHFIHHREVHRNYAIVEFWIDVFLGTRKEPNKAPSVRPLHAMHNNLLALALLIVLTGCQSRTTTIPVSRNSEMGRAMADTDAAQKQYQKNVALHRKAMMDYEKVHGGDCGNIFFSRLSPPIEVVGPRVQIHDLQGSSRRCGYQDYRVKIAYTDEKYFVVDWVEVLESRAK
jgi:hypothetical protein